MVDFENNKTPERKIQKNPGIFSLRGGFKSNSSVVCFRISNLLRSRTRDKKYTFSKWIVPLNLVTVLDGKIHVSVNPVLGKVYLLKVYLLSPSESNFRPAYDPKQHYGSARPYCGPPLRVKVPVRSPSEVGGRHAPT